MTERIGLHWHDRSGPCDVAGFCGVYPVARAYRDARSGEWIWTAAWLAGIGARGSAADKVEAIRAAEEAVGRWVGLTGLTEETCNNS